MYAERALGMTDAQVRRAPSASMSFIDSIVKFALNKTKPWLDKQDDSIINSARQVSVERNNREKAMQEEEKHRLKAIHQRREQHTRTILEKKLKERVHSDVWLDDINLDLDLDVEKLPKAQQMIA